MFDSSEIAEDDAEAVGASETQQPANNAHNDVNTGDPNDTDLRRLNWEMITNGGPTLGHGGNDLRRILRKRPGLVNGIRFDLIDKVMDTFVTSAARRSP